MADSLPREASAGGRRLPLVDVARGALLLAMASYHFSWDIANVRLVDWGVASDPLWRAYAAAIAGSFLFLSGLSFRLAERGGLDPLRYGTRLARLALAAAAVSVGTYIVFPEAWVFFGILHMMLLASLLAPLLVRLPAALLLMLAAAALVLPEVWRSPAFDGLGWGFLGLAGTPPVSNDLVPVFPWIAPYLAGLVAGGPLIRRAESRTGAPPLRRGTGWLAVLGRHSLLFYLLHQPLLYGLAVGLAAVLPVDPAVQRASFIGDCRLECTRQGADTGVCERFCGCVAASVDDTGIWNQRSSDPSFEPLLSTAVQACGAPAAGLPVDPLAGPPADGD
ncbi:heparan-alpha-glucosaminide N-acetyltransferase [Pleomorphomonas koreensis]|uniref:heparan-alpha-glucosaminide N-acetyltransferase n=1 Tax=Pleomorphomonas koreensis TaxID=257440 RepID=UPI00146A15DC|nr:heparan-alpha-glucosaminide N-acetyltransferase [Pleomorphomonas koreensis]